MNISFQLIKNRLGLLLALVVLSMLSCKKDDNTVDLNIKKTFNEYGYKGRAIIYRDKQNIKINNTVNYSFFTGPELLKNMDENFFLMSIIQKKNNMVVSIYSFKTGKALTCHFDRDVLKAKEIEYIKMEESKPFYIYYEILKRKYPSYMNWKLFPIPKDSLR